MAQKEPRNQAHQVNQFRKPKSVLLKLWVLPPQKVQNVPRLLKQHWSLIDSHFLNILQRHSLICWQSWFSWV